ncbi:MAG: ornithine carbamoyltransferase [Candidatus Microthrix sp.]|nr:ornithine carbamoyltransferase [Candidatus Microthrix sp.]MBK7321747.1 ornithine carbamoyltransferase [Candidatus Microthrix sp.]
MTDATPVNGAVAHFLSLTDLTVADLADVLARSADPNPPAELLKGRGVGLIFEKPSARTRNSTEMAVVQLGGHPVTIRPDEIGLGEREAIRDVARVLSRYFAVLGARTFAHKTLTDLAEWSQVPVVNLLTDDGHPIQILADLLTLQAEFNTLEGLEVAWVGDANNVARSLIEGSALAGYSVRMCGPDGYRFDDEELARAVGAGANVTVVNRPVEAVAGAHAIYTDTWTSMGQEDEAQRRRVAFAQFQVTEALLDAAHPDAILLHCLPAHRGEEVTDAALDGPRSRVFDQAENRMHAARGLIWWLVERTDGSRTSTSGNGDLSLNLAGRSGG